MLPSISRVNKGTFDEIRDSNSAELASPDAFKKRKIFTPIEEEKNVSSSKQSNDQQNNEESSSEEDDDRDPDELIKLVNVHKTYLMGLEGVQALRGINLTVKRGEFVCILGTSGGGKTTLLNIIGTIDKPTKGDLYL